MATSRVDALESRMDDLESRLASLEQSLPSATSSVKGSSKKSIGPNSSAFSLKCKERKVSWKARDGERVRLSASTDYVISPSCFKRKRGGAARDSKTSSTELDQGAQSNMRFVSANALRLYLVQGVCTALTLNGCMQSIQGRHIDAKEWD
jgi:hypothetical protein